MSTPEEKQNAMLEAMRMAHTTNKTLHERVEHLTKELGEEREKSIQLQRELDEAKAEIENLSIKLQRTVSAAYGALLETTAWMGIPEKKRENHINSAMGNVKHCAEHDLRQLDISKIENQFKQQLADYREALEQIKNDTVQIKTLNEANAYCIYVAEETLKKWRRE